MAVAVTLWNICFRFAHEFINIDCHEIKLIPGINTSIFITLRSTPPLPSPTPLPISLTASYLLSLIW